MNVKAPLSLWSFLFLFLVGCTVDTAYAPELEPEATIVPLPTETFAVDTAVIFKRTGGIAGLDETWTIFTDGRIETNSPTQSQLTANEVSQLLNSLESLGFFALNSSYLPEDTCCDRFFYEITAVQNSKFHTVTTLQDTPDMPEALQQSLRLIQTALFENNNQ